MDSSNYIADLYSMTFADGSFDSYPDLNLAFAIEEAGICMFDTWDTVQDSQPQHPGPDAPEVRAKPESSSLCNWDGAFSAPAPEKSDTSSTIASPSCSKHLLYICHVWEVEFSPTMNSSTRLLGR